MCVYQHKLTPKISRHVQPASVLTKKKPPINRPEAVKYNVIPTLNRFTKDILSFVQNAIQPSLLSAPRTKETTNYTLLYVLYYTIRIRTIRTIWSIPSYHHFLHHFSEIRSDERLISSTVILTVFLFFTWRILNRNYFDFNIDTSVIGVLADRSRPFGFYWNTI